MEIFNWFKKVLGFGKKKKTIAIDIETGGLLRDNPIYVTEGYKVEHKKHHEAMQELLKKIEDNKHRQLSGGETITYPNSVKMVFPNKKDNTEKYLDSFSETIDKHYSRPTTLDYVIETTLNSDILNTSDESSSSINYDFESRGFDEGFGGGDYSGGGAGSDYSSNDSYDDSSTRSDD